MTEERISRREFIRRVGLTGTAIAGAGVAAVLLHDERTSPEYFQASRRVEEVRLKPFGVASGPSDVRLAIAHGKDPEKLVRAALKEMGGISRFIRPGDVVVIKPNVAFDRAPALGATTNPAVLAAVARLCREAGARQVIVTDNPINQPEGAFYKSGIQHAAAEAGARVLLPHPGAFAEVAIGGEVLQSWPIFIGPFREATRVIGVAPCKDHNLCGASMTMKNWYGLLGGARNRFHQRIHGVIADFALMIQPTLVILDATRVLLTNGPTGGSLSDVAEKNTLVAGVDMVAVDAFGVTLLGRDPARLEYLQKAHARGLGNKDWKSLPHREVTV